MSAHSDAFVMKALARLHDCGYYPHEAAEMVAKYSSKELAQRIGIGIKTGDPHGSGGVSIETVALLAKTLTTEFDAELARVRAMHMRPVKPEPEQLRAVAQQVAAEVVEAKVRELQTAKRAQRGHVPGGMEKWSLARKRAFVRALSS